MRKDFVEFMFKVDQECQKMFGMSSKFLDKFSWYDCYAYNMTVEDTMKEFVIAWHDYENY